MLINMSTNAVMFKMNVQNVLCRLQRRLSVACAIHWSRCQSLPGPDGPIPPRHAGAALPRPWSDGGCTHTVVGSPRRVVDWVQIRLFGGHVVYRIRTARSILLCTVLTSLNVQFLFENIVSIFVAL